LATATEPWAAFSPSRCGGQRVDARDEDRCDGPDALDGLAGARPAFDAALVGARRLLVTSRCEEQRHVDVDAPGCELLDRLYARVGGRHLDHEVRGLDALPHVLRLAHRRDRVVRNVGGALEGDVSVAPAGAP
jgi:hypothetical protein